jgi:hypothetical protein
MFRKSSTHLTAKNMLVALFAFSGNIHCSQAQEVSLRHEEFIVEHDEETEDIWISFDQVTLAALMQTLDSYFTGRINLHSGWNKRVTGYLKANTPKKSIEIVAQGMQMKTVVSPEGDYHIYSRNQAELSVERHSQQ